MQEECMRCLEELDSIDMCGCVGEVAANRKQLVDRTNVSHVLNQNGTMIVQYTPIIRES